MFAGKKSAQIREILISESAWEEMTCLFAPSLKAFEGRRKDIRQTFNSGIAGITYAQLIAGSEAIDVKRANNAVDDGSGIKRAVPSSLKHNVVTVSVEASDRSEDQHHRVKVRFEEWDSLIDELGDETSAVKVTKKLCAGRVSFDCDCGRHQYWYRYIATAGNFALAPPKEYAFPKIRNPNLKGIACKHVIHAMTRLQSASWQLRIGQAMLQAAKRVGFGDDKRRTTKHFTEEDRKRFNKNRNSQTNQGAMRQEWDKYQRRQKALGNQIARDSTKLRTLSDKLLKARKMTQKQRAKAEESQQKLKAEQDKNKVLLQQLAGNDSNLLIVFYVQIMPDDFVMQLHR
ncbi:phage tail protein, partial [Escherichia coli]|nr:phage tail protein [Escherichia coli]